MNYFKYILSVLLCTVMVQSAYSIENEKGRLNFSEESWVEFHGLIQASVESMKTYDSDNNETASDAYWSKDVRLRSAMLRITGQVTDSFNYYFSMNLNSDRGAEIRDAFMDFRFVDQFRIAMGKIAVPFMNQYLVDENSFLGTEYMMDAAGMTTMAGYRDYGVQFHGMLINGLIDYRLGVFEGVSRTVIYDSSVPETKRINSNDWPRFTGRVKINLMDADPDIYYTGNHLGQKKIISIGGGMDFQKGICEVDNTSDYYLAWTVDFNMDYRIGRGNSIIAETGYLNVKGNPVRYSKSLGDYGRDYESYYAFFAQAGFLFLEKFQPTVKYIYRKNRDDASYGNRDRNISTITGGFNFFLKGHNANIKVEYSYPLSDGSKDLPDEKGVVLQMQLYI